MTREAVYGALFALGKSVTWAGGGFAFTDRRVWAFADVPAQPALCQAEHTESSTQKTNLGPVRRWKATWLIYFRAPKDFPPGAITTNAILDAVEAALAPPAYADTQTLGGLVAHCFVDGEIIKMSGDLDEQALLAVPITLLVP